MTVDDIVEKLEHLEEKLEDDNMGCNSHCGNYIEGKFKAGGCGYGGYDGYGGHDQEIEMFELAQGIKDQNVNHLLYEDNKTERRAERTNERICGIEKELTSLGGKVEANAERASRETAEAKAAVLLEMKNDEYRNLERDRNDKANRLNFFEFGHLPVAQNPCLGKR